MFFFIMTFGIQKYKMYPQKNELWFFSVFINVKI